MWEVNKNTGSGVCRDLYSLMLPFGLGECSGFTIRKAALESWHFISAWKRSMPVRLTIKPDWTRALKLKLDTPIYIGDSLFELFFLRSFVSSIFETAQCFLLYVRRPPGMFYASWAMPMPSLNSSFDGLGLGVFEVFFGVVAAPILAVVSRGHTAC